MYRDETLLFLPVFLAVVWFLGFGCFVAFLFRVSEYAEFQPLAKMTCAHRTHGVSIRAKKMVSTHAKKRVRMDQVHFTTEGVNRVDRGQKVHWRQADQSRWQGPRKHRDRCASGKER